MRFRYASTTDMSAQKARDLARPDSRGPPSLVIAKPEALPVPSRALPLSALWLNQTQVSPTPAVCLEDLNAVPDQPLQPGEWRASARAWIYNAALARLCRQHRTEERETPATARANAS